MLAVRSVIGAWRSAESEHRSQSTEEGKVRMGRKRIAALQVSPQQRERERPSPAIGELPPPCWDRRSFCSIGAQTDPWRTFHGPFLGGKLAPPHSLRHSKHCGATHSGVFPQWGNALLLYRCHWRLQFKSGTALPFWHCMGIHSLSLFLHGIVRSASSKAHKSTYLHSAHTHIHTHTQLAEIRHNTAQRRGHHTRTERGKESERERERVRDRGTEQVREQEAQRILSPRAFPPSLSHSFTLSLPLSLSLCRTLSRSHPLSHSLCVCRP